MIDFASSSADSAFKLIRSAVRNTAGNERVLSKNGSQKSRDERVVVAFNVESSSWTHGRSSDCFRVRRKWSFERLPWSTGSLAQTVTVRRAAAAILIANAFSSRSRLSLRRPAQLRAQPRVPVCKLIEAGTNSAVALSIEASQGPVVTNEARKFRGSIREDSGCIAWHDSCRTTDRFRCRRVYGGVRVAGRPLRSTDIAKCGVDRIEAMPWGASPTVVSFRGES